MDKEREIEFLARLQALKLNLPDDPNIEEKYVHEFHKLLDLLSETSGRDLNDFHVPDSQLHHHWLGQGEPMELTDEEEADEDLDLESLISDYRFCARNFLGMKIDGVLILFASEPPRPARPIGFRQVDK